jgi:hypothetical protein
MGSADVRAITDDEVAYCRDHGWVRLDQLISTEMAAQLLERAKTIMGSDASGYVARPGIDSPVVPWQDRHSIVEEDPLFAEVGLSEEMGANAQRLMRRNIGVLLYNSTVAVKIGSKQDSSTPASGPTGFHQDGAALPMDRAGRVAFWIALDHITPEMGLVRYVDRSHYLGSLGFMVSHDGYVLGDLRDVYPELREMALIEPVECQPGDAFAHLPNTVHDALANETDRPRWALVISYIPSDTIYTGAKTPGTPTQNKLARASLVAGEPFGGPEYPRVFGSVDR